MKNSFAVSTSVSPITGAFAVELEIEGRKITLQLVNSTTLMVASPGSGLTISTRMKPMVTDINLLTSRIEVLELSKKVQRQLERRGIELVFQIVDRGTREGLFGGFGGRLNSSRERWCDEVEAALAKKGLFLGMAIGSLFPKE